MPRSKRFIDMSRSMSQQQSSSSTHEQLLNDAPLEDIFPNQEQTQDNDTPQEQTQDSETPQEQNEDLQSSSKKKTRTTWEVDVINGEGFVKKKKLKVKEVWTLQLGEQIIVPFDNFGTPFTEAVALFTGTLAGLAQTKGKQEYVELLLEYRHSSGKMRMQGRIFGTGLEGRI